MRLGRPERVKAKPSWRICSSVAASAGLCGAPTPSNAARRSLSEQARAHYDAAVATYRQTTLQAFQQVEDNFAALRLLQKEQEQQQRATAASLASLSNFEARYQGGLELYIDVVTSQTAALANQRNDIDLMRRQLDASVLLIKALGGGWDTQQLPKL